MQGNGILLKVSFKEDLLISVEMYMCLNTLEQQDISQEIRVTILLTNYFIKLIKKNNYIKHVEDLN